MTKRRVVVTGLGMISPLGHDVATTWKNVLEGKSGIKNITDFDASQFTTRFAATVDDFDYSQYISSKEARKMDTFIIYGLLAAIEAFQDSGLQVTEQNADRLGLAIGSGIGGLGEIERQHSILSTKGARKVSPFFIPSSIINMISGYASIRFGFKGPNISLVSACTTGTHNIGYAMRTIQYGDADVMLAGGAEKASTPLGVGGFAASRALSTRNDDPQVASRPWDKDRDGFVLGDGAGVLMLEEYEHAKKRGAHIYAEIVGFGMSGDAYHITMPDGIGACSAMKHALDDAKLTPESIDYINAHATSTYAGDKVESQSIEKVFGEHAKKLSVSSTKSMTGHLLGAAGAVEAIFSILAIRDNVAPPTINLDTPDEGCNLDYVPNQAKSLPIKIALSNSFGFGGTNGTVIFKEAD